MIEIRNAEAGDIAGILRIEEECFDSDSWSEEDFSWARMAFQLLSLLQMGLWQDIAR